MQLGESKKSVANTCLNCGKKLNGIAQIDNAPTEALPEPGDISFCMYCGHIMSFGEDLKLRELTSEEMLEVAGDERILAASRARKLVNEGSGK